MNKNNTEANSCKSEINLEAIFDHKLSDIFMKLQSMME